MLVFIPSIQTLTSLNLSSNQIGDEGAHHLSIALMSNMVRKVSFSLDTNLIYFIFDIQTITTLDLTGNQIGNQGAKCLSHALQSNKVTKKFF